MKKVKKVRPLPASMKSYPKSREEAKKRKVKYFYSRKGNLILLHGERNDWQGRPIGKFSPKHPDETEYEMSVRLMFDLKDDSPTPKLPDALKEDQKAWSASLNGKPEEKEEDYPGTPLPLRDQGKLERLIRPGNVRAAKLPKPEGAKWKQIKQWAKNCFAHYAEKDYYLTIGGLLSLAYAVKWPEWKRLKLVRRVKALFQDELEREWQYTQALINRRPEEPALKRRQTVSDGKSAPSDAPGNKVERKHTGAKGNAKAECDALGNRLGTRTARINAALTHEFKSLTQLEKEVDAKGISSHLSKLVKIGYAFKKDGEYKVSKKWKGKLCCATKTATSPGASSPTDSSGSAGSRSTRPKAGSGGARKGKTKPPASSSGRSTKAKPAKSGKRPARRA